MHARAEEAAAQAVVDREATAAPVVALTTGAAQGGKPLEGRHGCVASLFIND